MSLFIDHPELQQAYAFLQWKNTYACFDFNCECGAHCHLDDHFAYAVECPHCKQEWEMPSILLPRKKPSTYAGTDPLVLEADEDWVDADGCAVPVQEAE